jgi:hypothetical protein
MTIQPPDGRVWLPAARSSTYQPRSPSELLARTNGRIRRAGRHPLSRPSRYALEGRIQLAVHRLSPPQDPLTGPLTHKLSVWCEDRDENGAVPVNTIVSHPLATPRNGSDHAPSTIVPNPHLRGTVANEARTCQGSSASGGSNGNRCGGYEHRRSGLSGHDFPFDHLVTPALCFCHASRSLAKQLS